MSRRDRIEQALTAALHPATLDVRDESHLHVGHAGARPGGETHYRIIISARAFQGTTLVARHRLVNEALRDEFATGLHALAIAATPAN
ncbi:MAG: BolA family transcriptional regulator [Hyphomicrobiales bacterium]|nr:BolA family transcriptional regulator [Hyphomicrobiales bacterium]